MSFDPSLLYRVNRNARTRLALVGPDRAKFLHNLTTNEIKRKPVGSGCETFVTSLQGKTLGWVSALVGETEILLRTEPGGLVHVLPLFEKYGLFDDVQWEDRSESVFEIHLLGDLVDQSLADLGAVLPDSNEYSHVLTHLHDHPIQIVRESPLGVPGLTILGKMADFDSLWAKLAIRFEVLDDSRAEGLRIEDGTPWFGVDISPENLPQEIGRDSRSISFVKGCYLGQETVARLDALGHVNKIMRGLKFRDDAGSLEPVPAKTALLNPQDKTVGTVGSSGNSAFDNQPVGLAIVKVSHAEAGTSLRWTAEGRSGEATVFNLPMIPVADRTANG